MRRLLSVVLSALLVLFAMPISASAHSDNIEIAYGYLVVETQYDANLYDVRYVDSDDEVIAEIYEKDSNNQVERFIFEKLPPQTRSSNSVSTHTFRNEKIEADDGFKKLVWGVEVKAKVWHEGSFGEIQDFSTPVVYITGLTTFNHESDNVYPDDPDDVRLPATSVDFSASTTLKSISTTETSGSVSLGINIDDIIEVGFETGGAVSGEHYYYKRVDLGFTIRAMA